MELLKVPCKHFFYACRSPAASPFFAKRISVGITDVLCAMAFPAYETQIRRENPEPTLFGCQSVWLYWFVAGVTDCIGKKDMVRCRRSD